MTSGRQPTAKNGTGCWHRLHLVRAPGILCLWTKRTLASTSLAGDSTSLGQLDPTLKSAMTYGQALMEVRRTE